MAVDAIVIIRETQARGRAAEDTGLVVLRSRLMPLVPRTASSTAAASAAGRTVSVRMMAY
jgi:hypothetical protein